MKNWQIYLFDPKDVAKIIQGANDWKNSIIRLENYQTGINRYDIEKVQTRTFCDDDKPLLSQLLRAIEIRKEKNGINLTQFLESNQKTSWAIELK